MDHDKDGKLSFVEFSDNAYNVFKNYVEFETSDVPIAEEKFAELDVNKNKYYTDIKLACFFFIYCLNNMYD